jgi:hydrogenase maturation protein HypF
MTPAMNATEDIVRQALTITGTVQGIGLRPFIFRTACELGLTGFVRNTAAEVQIEVQGAALRLDEFIHRLLTKAPSNSSVNDIRVSRTSLVAGELAFGILQSVGRGARRPAIPPDLATCAECLAELDRLSASRRAGYAFTSCSHCGPRYSITDDLPYDRATTTMRAFAMCGACAAEYSDPTDRRFHAQTIACPQCGPALSLVDHAGNVIEEHSQAISAAAQAIAEAKVVAIKGIGGFQLIVDGTDSSAVARLRSRKRRPDKPFALMIPDLFSARSCCYISDDEQQLLGSPGSPIVILRRRPDAAVAPNIAPGNPWLAVMLPYSPLHRLLLDEMRRPVVCTSGNLSDEPICIENGEAFARLCTLADLYLIHDREIVRPLDDSITRVSHGRVEILRRARGYAPAPIRVSSGGPVTLALGAHQKNTIGLAIGNQVTLSQHLGDLHSLEARSLHLRTVEELLRLFDVVPELIVCDLHPDYASTFVAEELATRYAIPLFRVQHHQAHIAACVAEQNLEGPVLGIAWDGTGYGTDGSVWGGEGFLHDNGEFIRIAHLGSFPLIGGEAAIRDPRRAALGLLFEAQSSGTELFASRWFGPDELHNFRIMIERGFNSPRTFAIGRLFDGVAALTGICERPTFDAQAAMQLEWALDDGADLAGAYPMPLAESAGMIILDWKPMLSALLGDLQHGISTSLVSARFHNALADGAYSLACHVGIKQIVFGGGCFQNHYLCRRLEAKLSGAGFRVFRPQQIPVNDGGIALGQIAMARNLWEGERDVSRSAR